MNSIFCKYCGQEISYEENNPPEECPSCLSRWNASELNGRKNGDANSHEKNSGMALDGFSLIYQKDGTEVSFPHAEEMILGRSNTGRNFFIQIPQISRTHLLIQHTDGRYLVTDLNSSNGTFLGVNKIDCKINPRQELKHGDILYMGREMFLVKLNFSSSPEMSSASVSKIQTDLNHFSGEEGFPGNPAPGKEKTQEIRSWMCRNCYNYKSEVKEFTCPVCNTYNS